MRPRGKNGAEIEQFVNDNTGKITSVSFDAPKDGDLTFTCAKSDTTFAADADAQAALLCQLTGADFQVTDHNLSALKNLPLLPQFKDVKVIYHQAAIEQSSVSPVVNKRRSGLWSAPHQGGESASMNNNQDSMLKKSM